MLKGTAQAYILVNYYTALLNAVECSIPLNEPSQRLAVNYGNK